MAFDTQQPAQISGLGGYKIDPFVTIGDTVEGYTPVGIPDGMGAYALNSTTVRVLVNHELGSTAGAPYTLANGTQLTGARVSFFDVDKATLKVVDSGVAYNRIINRAGEVVDAASDLEFGGIQRLCSATYIEAGQFGGRGLVDGLFFTGEEANGGSEYVIDPVTKTMYAVPWMGRAAWENVTQLDTGNNTHVALLIGDDRTGAPLLMYVGQKDTKAGAGLLERNGLANGKLYVWAADNGNVDPSQFKGTGTDLNGKFIELDYYRPDLKGTTGYDSQGFATQVKQDELARAVGAFQFSRPEDVSTNPFDGTEAVLASTGSGLANNADLWGTTYKINVDFNALLSTTATVSPALETTAPFLLPKGFTQTKIVDDVTANRDPDYAATFGNWDMIDLDPSGRYIYIPSEVGRGAGLTRYDTQTGDFVTALKGNATGVRSSNPATWNPANDDYTAFDPATYTPYGTVLVAEETDNGRLFEWLNPLAAPGVAPQVVWRSAIPSIAHEGLRFDSKGTLYFIDEDNTGSIYKFVPKTVGDLSAGQTFVLKVNAYNGNPAENWNSASNLAATRTGAFTWVAVTDANGKALTQANPFDFTKEGGRLAGDELGATPYGRPEDMEIIGDNLYLATTSENTVYRIDLKSNSINVFANRNTIDGATGLAVGTNLNNPDNIARDSAGNIFIIEDNNPGDIWKASDNNADGVAETITRWASLTVPGAEPTGLISTKNPSEFLVAIQHPSTGNDALWKITAGEITANVKILYNGDDAGAGKFAGPDFGLRSPDNLDWASDGFIYLQEDRSVNGFGAVSGEEASIWKLNPTTGALSRIAKMDRSAVPAGQTDTAPLEIGNWESSGILDVSSLFGKAPATFFIGNTQAHSLRGGAITSANLVEGGQVFFLSAPASLPQINGGAGNDTLFGTGASEQFNGGEGNNTLFGNGGNDLFIAGAGNDQAYGGGGNDRFELGGGINVAYGNGGNDSFVLGLGNDTIYGGGGNDVVDAGNGENVVYGNGGNDRILTGSGKDTIYAGGGDDFINVGNGDNLIYGNGGNDTFIAGSGNDTIYAGGGNDFITVGSGDNLIYGNGGNDTIITGAGNDLVYGGGGNESFNVGTGNDLIYSNGGADVLFLNAGAGSVTFFGWSADDRLSRGSGITSTTALSVSVVGSDTQILAGTDLLATLKWVQLGAIPAIV